MFSGQIPELLTDNYVAMMICSTFIYAAIGSVICMLSMLIKSNIASMIICLSYVMFSDTLVSVIKSLDGLTELTAKLGDWLISHSIYGMSLSVHSMSVSAANIFPIFMNSAVIIFLSTTIGLFLFRKYELLSKP